MNLEIYPENLMINYAENMADMTKKWGILALDGKTISFRPEYLGVSGDLELVTSPDIHKQGVIVDRATQETDLTTFRLGAKNIVRLPSRSREEGKLIKFVTQLEVGTLMWNTDLDLIEVTRIMLECDAKAREMGLMTEGQREIRPNNGARLISKIRKVAEVFKGKGVIYPLINGVSIEEELKNFDNPDELEVRVDPYSGKPMGLAKISDGEYIEKQEKVLNEVLIENFNLTLEALIEGMAKDPEMFRPLFLKIKAKVDEKMKDNDKI